MATNYNSQGHHPGSTYMVSDGKAIHNLSGLDLIVDIAGVYFPLRTLQFAAMHNVGDEHGTGSHDPWALPNLEHTYTGSFSYATYLVNGTNVLTKSDMLALATLLHDQADEGLSKYFDIYIIEVQGKRTPTAAGAQSFQDAVDALLQSESAVGYIEALVNCKVTKTDRNFGEKTPGVSTREFKYMYKLPRG